MTNANTVRTELEGRLTELAARVQNVEEELRAPISASFAEQATEMEGAEVLVDLEQAALSEIAAIRAAIARIDDGLYGECASCGKAIAPARLTAIPYATLCIQCADKPIRK
jgi:DnaK suppressor protein